MVETGTSAAADGALSPGGAPPPKAEPKAGGGGAGGSASIHTAPLESFWGVPLLRVFIPSGGGSRSGAAQAELEGQLIEHFLALLSMPKPLLGLAAAKAEKGRAVAQPPLAEALLAEVDGELSAKLVGLLGERSEIPTLRPR